MTAPAGSLGLGMCCCPNCLCLTNQSGNYQLNPHVRFAGNVFGIQFGVSRQVDLTLWKGYAADTPGPGKSLLYGIRVPTSGKPRLLLLVNQPNSLSSADFDALGARQGCLFECQANVWTLLTSNNFSYLGESVDASQAAVDGVAMVPIFGGFSSFIHPPDAAWCNPSYVPSTVQVTFANWQNQNMGAPGELRRAHFNGVPMAIPLTGAIVLGSRTFRNYGTSFGPAFYSDPSFTCAGNIAWPKDTLRWRLRAQTNTATIANGTASQTWVLITEDQVNAADSHGCHSSWSSDLGAPRYTGFFKYLSTFDRLDDQPLVTHWIKKGDTSASNSIPDGVTYWTSTFNFNPSAPAIGDLLRVFP